MSWIYLRARGTGAERARHIQPYSQFVTVTSAAINRVGRNTGADGSSSPLNMIRRSITDALNSLPSPMAWNPEGLSYYSNHCRFALLAHAAFRCMRATVGCACGFAQGQSTLKYVVAKQIGGAAHKTRAKAGPTRLRRPRQASHGLVGT